MAFAGHLGVSLNVDLLVTEGDGIADSRAEYGDSKNWAAQQVNEVEDRAGRRSMNITNCWAAAMIVDPTIA